MVPLRPPDEGSERRAWQRRIVCAEINKRRVNEAIERGRPDDQTEGPFVCECGRIGCNTILHLTDWQYGRVRTSFERFLIAPGHEIAELDEVDETHREYAVAVKRGAADILDEADDVRETE
jgi:hypothetical protein